jgi:hypothetical protein
MPARVTHRPTCDRRTPATCPDPEEHQRCWTSLDIAAVNGLWTHPAFTHHIGPDGRREAITASMACGCTWVGIVL